ncbi:Hypothetical protein BN69_1754 [Methylocystis sp. SC2]|nr:Hypothetical protein BN69_1754 [Methylocystis sp. SC2]
MCARSARIWQPLCRSAVGIMRLRRRVSLQYPCRESARSVQNQKWALWTKRGGFSEGKIKEDGTMSGRFRKLSLSAHWLGGARAAPHF